MKTSRPNHLRLGVNIDHIATVRNARGIDTPSPLRAAQYAKAGGADSITAHLREDRRHIKDADIDALTAWNGLPLNLEMAATVEMQAIALRHKPHAVCLVPEKREELTTEGGLDVAGQQARLTDYISPLRDAGSRVSLFIDPDSAQIEAAAACGAAVVELHTGTYCEVPEQREAELKRLQHAAKLADELGLEVHAGHGLNFATVQPIAAIPEIVELNIGHFLMGEAMFIGLENAVREMRRLMLARA